MKGKKWLAILMAVLLFGASTPAKAITGIVSSRVELAVLGGIVLGIAINDALHPEKNSSGKFSWPSVFMGLVGLIALDDKNGHVAHFRPLTKQDQKDFGVTDGELASFNSEIGELNKLKDVVTRDLSKMKRPDFKDANEMWTDFEAEELLSQDTFSALKKMVTVLTKGYEHTR